MVRRAFTLGFFSIGGQVLLLRELVAVLNGDELFIATALFGWLIAVALGAFIGGERKRNVRAATLLLIGSVALPIIMTCVRLLPLILCDTPGQIIPFSAAAAISAVVMLPIGVISGWLFPAITRGGGTAADAIAKVYLFEGIGAFLGGLAILLAVGQWMSTLQAGVAMILFILLVGVLPEVRLLRTRIILIALALAVGGVLLKGVHYLEHQIDSVRYRPYDVLASFDTHYGRQAILRREGEMVLLTDNTVEASYPELSTAEDLLIPPLIYYPEARRILYIGRPEFGVAQLAERLPGVELTFADPRTRLTEVLASLSISDSPGATVEPNFDWLSAQGLDESEKYDIIVVNSGTPDTYKSSRYMTDFFMRHAPLTRGGTLFFPTSYDTDSHISPGERQLLSIIYATSRDSFGYVEMWPGSRTLLFCSDSSRFDIPMDSINIRLGRLGYEPQFVSEDYLIDRLSSFKRERLIEAAYQQGRIHSVTKPLLPHYQALYRAKSDSIDRIIMKLVSARSIWLIAVPIVIAAFFIVVTVGRAARERGALFLYFTAGAVSLSLEMVSFYVFQSYAGSLYSMMALMIGSFMLGLSVGAYIGWRSKNRYLGHLSMVLMLLAMLIFLSGYRTAEPDLILYGSLAFLLVVATATGMLFVAATKVYYASRRLHNQGTGYAAELIGSSAGALLATPILLPLVGLDWLLVGLIALVALAFVSLLRTSRQS